MLSQNIKRIRSTKGLLQEELAGRLNVVRQTVSKWERGLSVPNADLLIALSKVLEVPVATLLGSAGDKNKPNDLKELAQKLELINAELARTKDRRQKIVHVSCLALMGVIALIFIFLLASGSSYLEWDYADPETAVVGVGLHSLEWLFVRVAPVAFIATLAGAILSRNL